MEKLKELNEIMLPDSRQSLFMLPNEETGEMRPQTLNDFYMEVASIKLHEGVPEEIRSHFATAQNLLVYSWFYYPFNVTAQFMAFVSLEFALRQKFCQKKEMERISFKELVKMAVERGLVKDGGFSHIQANNQDVIELINDETEKISSNYGKILIDTVPFLRNKLAHGSPALHCWGPTSVRICAEFINQLYPKK